MRWWCSAALLILPVVLFVSTCNAHNITHLLAKHPEFSTFNHYLSLTHLAEEINERATITVLAVDNAAMSRLLDGKPSIYTVKNALSIHILLDYFGAQKLHEINKRSAIVATVFQSTGTAPGSSGFVNITDSRGGKVQFGPEDNNGTLSVSFVKSVAEIPYNISVVQVSSVIPNEVADAPAPGPESMNLTDIMSLHGCKVFADTLLASPEASRVYQDNLEGGLTVFCPLDEPFKAFLPRFKNLTAPGKVSFLEFFGVPLYMSTAYLKSNNGLKNTLATDGAKSFDFTIQNDGEDVTLETRTVTAKVSQALFDEQPLVVYAIDEVLLPKELFKDKKAASPAPAPAPAKSKTKTKAKAKAPSSKKPQPHSLAAADSPADSPDGDVADQEESDKSSAYRFGNGRVVAAMAAALLWMLSGL